MRRFRNILLVAGLEDGPVPGHLFDRALTLSRRNAAKLTLIDVVPELELVPEVLPQEVLELTLRGRRESLLRLAESAREEGLEVETAIAAGTPFLEITRRVQQFEHDLVTTHGGRGRGCGVGDGQYNDAPDAQVPLRDLGCSADPRRPLLADHGRNRSRSERCGKGLSESDDHGTCAVARVARGERALADEETR